jgi:hypothetical protein
VLLYHDTVEAIYKVAELSDIFGLFSSMASDMTFNGEFGLGRN